MGLLTAGPQSDADFLASTLQQYRTGGQSQGQRLQSIHLVACRRGASIAVEAQLGQTIQRALTIEGIQGTRGTEESRLSPEPRRGKAEHYCGFMGHGLVIRKKAKNNHGVEEEGRKDR